MTNHLLGNDERRWDEAAPWYDHTIDLLEPELVKVSAALLAAVDAGPGKRLLDLACGPGHVTAAAHQRGAEATGLDRSTAMVAIARRRFPEMCFQVGDMVSPLDGPWDGIVCRFGAHHVDEAWVEAAANVLASGGVLAIAEFVPADDPHGGHPQVGHGHHAEMGFRDEHGWLDLFVRAGLHDVMVTPCPIDLAPLVERYPELGRVGPHGHGPPMLGRPVFIVSGRR